MVKRLILWLATTVIALGWAGVALADQITSFQSDITVTSANVINITETITYDPQGAHHGIIRFVPAKFQDSAGHTYYTAIKFDSVTDQSGKPYQIAAQHNNRSELYLQIGNPKVTFTDPHTYIVKYSIAPLAVSAGDHDRLTINLTGQEWQTTINQVSATISLPTSPQSATCYAGPTGSTITTNCSADIIGNQINVTSFTPLQSQSGMTVDVNLPPGSFSTYLVPDHPLPLSGAEKAELAAIVIAALIWLFALARLIVRWLQDLSQARSQTVIPQYDAPDNLRPSQMSILESPRSDVADITATILDLAVRGYLKIELLHAKAWYREANYRLSKLKDSPTLLPFESKLFGALFAASDTLDLKDLQSHPFLRQALALAITDMRKLLGDDLKQKGYYTTSPTAGWTVAKVVIILTTLAALVASASTLLLGSGSLVFVAMATAGAVASLLLSFVKTDRTLLGQEERSKIKGFKWFLSVTEADRLNFTDAPDKTPQLFSSLLPYAVALKVEKKWAKQFESIDVNQAVGGWYVGGGNFNASGFASGISSGFSSAVSSSFAGSSGGGGAGGGGGGGGGGGW